MTYKCEGYYCLVWMIAEQLCLIVIGVKDILIVSVLLGGYNKMLQSRWITNHKNLFQTALEAGEYSIKSLADSMSGETLLPDW